MGGKPRPVPRDSSPQRPPLTERPCSLCRGLAQAGKLRVEAVQRIPEGAWAPLSRYIKARDKSVKICFDCASAELLVGRGLVPDFDMARIAVANDRQEQYRLPGALIGLVAAGFMRPSESGDFKDQIRWLEANNYFEVGSR